MKCEPHFSVDGRAKCTKCGNTTFVFEKSRDFVDVICTACGDKHSWIDWALHLSHAVTPHGA